MTIIAKDVDMQEAIDKWIARKKLSQLLELWARGVNIDWNKLCGDAKPRRVSLPTYPFAREHYWVQETTFNLDHSKEDEQDVNIQAIEEIINKIGDEMLEAGEGVRALKMLM